MSGESMYFVKVRRETSEVRHPRHGSQWGGSKSILIQSWLLLGTLMYGGAAGAQTAALDNPAQAGPQQRASSAKEPAAIQSKPASGTGGKTEPDAGVKTPANAKPDEKAPTAKPLPQLSPEARYDYQGEATFIPQHLFAFHSPYAGPLSLPANSETRLSQSYTLYLGARLKRNVEVYVNPELAIGNGIGQISGLAGYANGDIIGQPFLSHHPYPARYFVRWRIPLKQHGIQEVERETVGRAPNLIAGKVPARRVVVTAGKFAVNDIFDVNSYANNPRTQFLNNAFFNNLAYDYAQDARGYTTGLSAAWVNPNWALRAGTFAMPTSAGGIATAYSWRNHGDQLEGEVHPQVLGRPKPPLILRLLTYRNVADMGRYQDALAAQPPGMVPDITAVRQSGTARSGWGLNFEQALADGGATGIFGRLGWSNGNIENYSYTECDRFFSVGAQVSGAHWHRQDDRIGLAFASSGLAAAHRDYLAAGGLGFTLGDTHLKYGAETVLETYYAYQFSKPLSLALDYQYVRAPGYNRDRGPVSVLSLRLHYGFRT